VQGCYVGWSVSCDIKSCVVRVFFYFLLRIKKSYSSGGIVLTVLRSEGWLNSVRNNEGQRWDNAHCSSELKLVNRVLAVTSDIGLVK
jgi:hypothetical protein